MNAWSGFRDPAARIQAATGVPPPALPLDQEQARQRAVELRRLGWDYPAISRTMAYYHGHWASAGAWSYRIRTAP